VVLLAARAVGGAEAAEAAVPGAAALELVHAYSLVHDDLPCMDDDDERRGRPSCHVAFGEALAVLAGDALLTEAFGLLAAAPWPAEARVRAVAALAEAAGLAGMVGGQVMDTDPDHPPEGPEDVDAMHGAKTAALFVCAGRLGGLAAGASEAQLADLRTFGEALGRLFQVTDDLLDWEGEATPPEERRSSLVARLGVEGTRARAERLRGEAHDALAPLGESAAPLAALCDKVLHRRR